MAFAAGSRHGVRYIKEQQFGVVPDNPVMTDLRITSCSLVLSKDSFQSNEIRRDAQISDLRHGVKQANGDIGIELSYGAFDEFLAALVRGEWEDNVLVAGIDMPTFTIERVFSDIDQYETFTGCAINTLNLQIQTNAMITGTFGIVGRGANFTDGPTATESIPSPANPPLDGFTGTLKEGGVPIGVVTSISISCDNSIQPANVLGSDEAAALVPGRINITGSMSAYFENLELLNKFLHETESELEIILGDGGPGSYILTLPRIKYTGGSNPVDGEGPIMLDMPFQALLDACTGTNIRIERIPLPEKVATACILTWDKTSLQESSDNNGRIDGAITVTLSGGNGKEFSGWTDKDLPGVVFEDVPAGLTGVARRMSPTTCKIWLEGEATSHASTDSFSFKVRFTGASFHKGYCECLGDTVEGSEKTISVTFSDNE